jgi:uncharacterized protein with FMN-binding domain
MKKALVIIIAVAILGFLGLQSKNKSNSANTVATSPSGLSSPAPTSTTASSSSSTSAAYKDGDYTGSTAQTPYGPVQVTAVISGGKMSDIKFLQMPSDEPHSREVTSFSEPRLKQLALSNQTAQIDFVSGATSTSEGFEQSLQAALDQAAA